MIIKIGQLNIVEVLKKEHVLLSEWIKERGQSSNV